MNSLWRRIRPFLSTTVRFFRISYLEARSDYEGTRIGLFWMPLSTLIFAALLGTVFHTPGVQSQADFFLYVLCGYVTWNFISATISESIRIIQARYDFAVHSGLNMAGLFAKELCDRLFEYGVDMLVFLAALVLLKPSAFALPILLFPLFLIMLSLTSLALSYIINLTTMYFPDLSTIIKTAARVMFFATPVFWSAGNASGVKLVLEQFNPAAYYLKMGRQVFSIEPFAADVWLIGVLLTVTISLLGAVLFARTERFVRNLK